MSARAEFSLSARSGLIAGAVSADGVLFAWRNPPTLLDGSTNRIGQRLKMLVAKARTVTGFPTAQEIALSAHVVSVFGSPVADYTGGTDLSDQTTANAIRRLGPDPGPKPQQVSVLRSGNVRIATTAALSHAGSPTIETHPFASDSWNELASNAVVQTGGCDLVWTPSPEGSDHCKGLLMLPGTGFIIKVPVALGATGTIRLWVEAFFEES